MHHHIQTVRLEHDALIAFFTLAVLRLAFLIALRLALGAERQPCGRRAAGSSGPGRAPPTASA